MIHIYVNTSAPSNGDGSISNPYNSLTAAFVLANFPATRLEDVTMHLSGETPHSSTLVIASSNVTTDVYHLYLEGNRTLPYWDSSAFSIEVSGANCISNAARNVHFIKLQIRSTATGWANIGIYNGGWTGAGFIEVDRCIIVGAGGGQYHSGIEINDGNVTANIRNNLIYGFHISDTSPADGIFMQQYNSNSRIDNNTIYDCYFGIHAYSSGFITRNNLVFGCTNANYNCGANASSVNNVSSDGTAPGADVSNLINQTVNVRDLAARDFRLTTESSNCLDNGVNLTTDTYDPFSVDLVGNARPVSASWDRGALEYVEDRTVLEQIADAVWERSVRTLDSNSVKASDGTYLDNIAYAVWTRSVRTLSGGGGSSFFASIADTVGLTDAVATVGSFFRSVADNVGLTDAVGRIGAFIRALNDTVGVTTLNTRIGAYFRALNESVGVSDAVSNLLFKLVAIYDSVGVTDSMNRVGTFFRAAADTVGLTDVASRIGMYARVINDTVGLTDVPSKLVFKLVAIYDSVGVSDTFTKVGTYFRGIADSVSVTDAATRVGSYFRSIANSVGVTDVVTKSASRFITILNNVGVTDALSRQVAFFRTISDTVGLTDLIIRGGIIIRVALSDVVGIIDVVSKQATYVRLISDTVGLFDSVIAKFKIWVKDSFGKSKITGVGLDNAPGAMFDGSDVISSNPSVSEDIKPKTKATADGLVPKITGSERGK